MNESELYDDKNRKPKKLVIFLLQTNTVDDAKKFVRNFKNEYKGFIEEYNLKIKDLTVVFGEYDVFLSLEHDPTYLVKKFGKSLLSIYDDMYHRVVENDDISFARLLFTFYEGKK